ncbi:hypothetical protein AA958_06875 [Streptomyces sp. CNQ-509]|uniref:hypothetical protein n=1 Tax=unclassified Streptomyces TaxID=2593676 RepID=UPI00062DE150|nr:hypothetical protein [Streptomyces sp. CNQ-509]AKH81983.1 hypothetical protein AA958_06875 [Streptomyces sp. CNQ-509]
MQKDSRASATPLPSSAFPSAAPLELDGGLAELRTDCARMAPHWSGHPHSPAGHVPDTRISGLARIMVPSASADLLRGMSEYGD